MRFVCFFNQFNHLLVNTTARELNRRSMACSRYEYVKKYEQDDTILPNVWIVIRIDGKKFHKFSKTHNFEKPNDENALNVMNAAATAVMQEFRDVVLAFGQSDEYSFVFRKDTAAFKRRSAKLLTYVTSLFSTSYVMQWTKWMSVPLAYAPCFDGRVVLYPSNENLRDYLSWRQADVHVNNLYNTAFWKLVLESGFSNQKAEERLRGTLSADKNELLFQEFGLNYNNLPAMYRKGTILLRKRVISSGDNDEKGRQAIVQLHEDLISSHFWKSHTEILGKYVPGTYKASEALPRLVKLQLSTKQEQKQEKQEEQKNPENLAGTS
ncbi:probable tRNA(His) guanylyltransferase [Drosophila subobscura]|uniref:probable tRNA(His) guanylyltransferase n=1 Tax=Drosophila subobscura TaxID=7241 RepID=UPI00155AE0F7|nr:probable tRNA(His) guanylyltransferase [Drosophila subobscura]XP_034667181.1 probable tRNA(His) guanylyltransferase [Drosophila subobscura]